MLKNLFYAFLPIIISTTFIGNTFAADSTNLKPHSYTPQLPAVVQNTAPTECVEAPKSRAVFVLNSGTTLGWSQSSCPTGYMPYAIKTRVDIAVGNGAFQWRNYCCKVVLKY